MNLTITPSCQIPVLADIYNKYFNDIKKGTFVEIGAFDGELHSNTACLADIGWRGLYVEPVPFYADDCRTRHINNDIMVLNVAAGKENKWTGVHVAESLSTVKEEFIEACKTINSQEFRDYYEQHKTDIYIPILQVCLDDILEIATIEPGFELLVVDVEGSEWDIFSTFPLSIWRPHMVIVEMHEQSPEWQAFEWSQENCKQLNDYFTYYWYDKIYSDDINSIFIRFEWRDND